MTAATGTDGAVKAARAEVDQAEARLAGGAEGVNVDALHRLRDRFRHADLSAKGAQVRAEQERQAARLAGLEEIGLAVDQMAADGGPAAELAAALKDVAEAATRAWKAAGTHDAAVASLVAAANDLHAEPMAPAGPRGTSAHVAVDGRSIVHKRVKIAPVRDQVGAALGQALGGDTARAVATVRPVTEVVPAQRPDHLIRGGSGALIAMTGPLSPHIAAQVRSGEATAYSDHDIDAYMQGELA